MASLRFINNMLSIIIIVKNDRGIDDTLVNIESQNISEEYEVIVVDASLGKLDDIKKKHKNTRWIDFVNDTNKKITIPEQRNLGIKSAHGNIIVFIDAGCIPEQNWLQYLATPILRNEEQIVAGKTLSLGERVLRDQTAELNKNKKYLVEAPTINLAIKKSIFNDIGIFDTQFPFGEDIDFTWRCIDNGYKIRYSENAIVKHSWGNWHSDLMRSYNYGLARARLYKKHYTRWKHLFTNDLPVIVYPIFIVFLPLTFYFWFYPFLLLVPFIKNIKHKPFQVLSDHLLYGLGVIRGIFTL